MPKASKKRAVMNLVCKTAVLELVWSTNHEEAIKAFDNALSDLSTLSASRYLKVRQPVPKSDHWYTTILPEYDEIRFKQFERVGRIDFCRILRMIEDNEVFTSGRGRKQFPVDMQLAITLHKFGNNGTGNGLANVAAKFGIGDGGTIMRVVSRVTKVKFNAEVFV